MLPLCHQNRGRDTFIVLTQFLGGHEYMPTLSFQAATHMHKQGMGGPKPRPFCDFTGLEIHWEHTEKLPCSFLHSTKGGVVSTIPAWGRLTADCFKELDVLWKSRESAVGSVHLSHWPPLY